MRIVIYINKFLFFFILCFLLIASQAQNVLKVQGGVILSTTGGASITLNDMDFDNDGIFTQGIGQGTIVFKGGTFSNIRGNSSTLFDVLQVEKTGQGRVILQQGIRIASNITFITGHIELNGQNILLSPFAFLNNESENSRIAGANGGFVQVITTLASPSAAHPGNLGLEITSPQNLGSVTIRRGHRSQTNFWGNGSTILRYYDIIPDNNTALNAKLRIHYLDGELNNLNKTDLTLWTSSDNASWTNLGFSTRNTMSNFVEQGGISHFSRFTLSSSNNALPLQWGSFNTQCIAGRIQISWKTELEQNTSMFTIRRSADGNTWSDIGKIPAAGNSQSTLSYSFTDPQPSNGITYYQVYQQDLDGRKTFSPVLTGQCSAPEGIKLFPVPTQNNCWVSIQSERNYTASMRLYTVQGALLQQRTVGVVRGNNVFELSLAKYPSGVYSLIITSNNGEVKLMKVEKN